MDPQPIVAPSGLYLLLDTLLRVSLPALFMLASWAVLKIASFFKAKTKFEIPKAQIALLDEWALRGIHYAEEKARAFMKQTGSASPGVGKLNDATTFVMQFVEKQGWVEWTREKVEKYIEAKLNLERALPPAEKPPL